MKKRKFADGGEVEAMLQMQRDMAVASNAAAPPGGPRNPGGPSMGLGSTPPGSAQPSMGPAPDPALSSSLPNSRFSPRGRAGITRQYANGGSVNSKASSRADGCAQRGKTKGRMV